MAVKNGRFDLVGDKAKISKSVQRLVGSDPQSGKFQKVGDEEKMSDIRVNSPSAWHNRGEYQKVGDELKMSRKGIVGWGNAYNLPMSQETRADNQATGVEGNSKTKSHGRKE